MPSKSSREGIFSELFVEIGVEEIPSDVMASTLRQLSEIAADRLKGASFVFDPPQVYGTPRRLILYLPRLSRRQETRTEIMTGPPKKAAFDPAGNPTAAAVGFAKSQGVSLSELKTVRTEKGEYLSIEKQIEGRPTPLLLKTILPDILSRLTFPRSMRWNGEGTFFVRPIRWIVALYGRKVVPFSYAGISSGNVSWGHRLMAPGPFKATDFGSYQKSIRRRFVLIDPQERFDRIQGEMKKLAKEKDGEVEEDPALVWQAAFMVEYPKAVLGSFDRPFLEIPKEVIITAMKEHQGYFPLHSAGGALLPHFITIANNSPKNIETIRRGNERVLRARLVDATFYFEQDRKVKLSDRREALKGVTFQEKLGTVYEKVQRLERFVKWGGWPLDDKVKEDIRRAASLCKCDLLTGVVREFPSLQGVMGRIYATHPKMDGESPTVAEAIEEHYLPRFSGGPLPKSPAGQILAVADKLDTVVGCFGAGLIPSGSEDPYALRRQGLGVIQIFLEEGPLREVSLKGALQMSIREYENQQKKISGETTLLPQVTDFLKQRIASHLQSKGFRYDLIDAVLAKFEEIEYPFDIVERVMALDRFSRQTLFGPLTTSFKRAIRILPKGFEGEGDSALIKEDVEKELHQAIRRAQEGAGREWVERRYEKGLEALATLYEPLNHFFIGVMVMDSNEAVRNNRLGLLNQVRKLFEAFGDFSKIVEGEVSPKSGVK